MSGCTKSLPAKELGPRGEGAGGARPTERAHGTEGRSKPAAAAGRAAWARERQQRCGDGPGKKALSPAHAFTSSFTQTLETLNNVNFEVVSPEGRGWDDGAISLPASACLTPAPRPPPAGPADAVAPTHASRLSGWVRRGLSVPRAASHTASLQVIRQRQPPVSSPGTGRFLPRACNTLGSPGAREDCLPDTAISSHSAAWGLCGGGGGARPRVRVCASAASTLCSRERGVK